jgi:hypothetical protein
MLMSTGDGNANIKAEWPKVARIMASWGYTFTVGAMCEFSHSSPQAAELIPSIAQHWSKVIQKELKERRPDNANNGGTTNPTTPSKANSTRSRNSKAPTVSSKGKGKATKRAAAGEEDTSPESGGSFNPTPIAKEKTPRASAKKMKYSEQTDVEDDDEEREGHVIIKGEAKTDEDFDHAT